MGGETLKQLTIQVSRARPPGPAWLRRAEVKASMPCRHYSHCPLDSG